MRVKRKVSKSLITRGVLGTARFIVYATWNFLKSLRPSSRRQTLNMVEKDLEFDRKYGTDTVGIIPMSNLDVQSQNWIYGGVYQAILPSAFNEVMQNLNIIDNDFTFIDFGSGKGRAVLLASAFEFKKIIGIEFSKELVSIAENNLKIFPEIEKKCKNIEFVCIDAVKYELPLEPLMLYFYNPFEKIIMDIIANNVLESFNECRRRIIVVYFTPFYSGAWDSLNFLKKIKATPNVCVYDTNHACLPVKTK